MTLSPLFVVQHKVGFFATEEVDAIVYPPSSDSRLLPSEQGPFFNVPQQRPRGQQCSMSDYQKQQGMGAAKLHNSNFGFP